MESIKAWFFIIFGFGLVAVALQGAVRGWLPNGPNGYKKGTGVARSEQPVTFWAFFLLYFAGGGALTVHALKLLITAR